MPDVAPLRLHISRHYGLSVPPSVPHGGWATCKGRSPGSRLKRLFPAFPTAQCGRQWRMRQKLAAYSCGSSLGFDTSHKDALRLTVFPFHHCGERAAKPSPV